ncbi:MAG: dihydroorotase [Acidobacteria bacterium]|nr:MAG: dihydroorotase [Acidobacteriota bacterium]
MLIRNGRVISPEDHLDGDLDLLIEDGEIREIAQGLIASADESIDARGQIVAPGFVDIHVHLREPGGEISETLESGLRAAVAGGFTAVCPMPNTRPVNDSQELTRRLVTRAEELKLARVFPIAAVTVGSMGERLTDFEALMIAGAVGFSDDGKPVKTSALMKEALEKAKALGVPIIDHCEVPELSAGGVMNEGVYSTSLGLHGISNSAEDGCIARDIEIAEATGGHLHVAHLSTAGGVRMVREAKGRGLKVTCEVTPHHFTLTDEDVTRYGTNAKMNPPLRKADDVEAILQAIHDGVVDAIATDHAPHAKELKSRSMAEAPFGVTGLETALALGLKQLVHSGKISIGQLIALMSSKPASIINKPFGRIRVGGAADLTVFDPDLKWTYRAAAGSSRSHNSPFDGWKFLGAVTATVVEGRIVFRRGIARKGGASLDFSRSAS